MRLFNRKAVLTVDIAIRQNQANLNALGVAPALQVPCGKDGFDIRFDIRKDLTGKPNRAQIEIYNLSRDHRDSLSEHAAKGPVRVRLDAGYGDNISRIFEGDLRTLHHDHDSGADFVTTIASGDGDRIVSSARISKSWAPGTPVETVIRDLTQELNLGDGNLRATMPGVVLQGAGLTFIGGTAVSGPIAQELGRICKSVGIDWSIQDGTMQFLPNAQALSGTAVKVTSSTGMEGASKILSGGKHGKRLQVTTRLIPGIYPGRKIQLEDKSVWRVDKARYHGETRGNAWNIHIEARPA